MLLDCNSSFPIMFLVLTVRIFYNLVDNCGFLEYWIMMILIVSKAFWAWLWILFIIVSLRVIFFLEGCEVYLCVLVVRI